MVSLQFRYHKCMSIAGYQNVFVLISFWWDILNDLFPTHFYFSVEILIHFMYLNFLKVRIVQKPNKVRGEIVSTTLALCEDLNTVKDVDTFWKTNKNKSLLDRAFFEIKGETSYSLPQPPKSIKKRVKKLSIDSYSDVSTSKSSTHNISSESGSPTAADFKLLAMQMRVPKMVRVTDFTLVSNQ